MPIRIDSIEFTPLNDVTSSATEWLIGNIMDRIQIDIEFTAYSAVIGTESDPILITNDGQVPTSGSTWIQLTIPGFTEFNVGDSIKVVNSDTSTTDTYTILEKKDNYSIRVDDTIADNSFKGFISVNTPITGVEFEYNFIENNANPIYTSLFDGKQIKSFIKDKVASDVSSTTMTQLGFLLGGSNPVLCEGIAITDGDVYESSYKITLYTHLLPIAVVNELTEFLNSEKPAYYLANKCPKFIYKIRAYQEQTNPNKFIEGEFTANKGNVGWYNENLNIDLNYYSISDLAFVNEDSDSVDAIELNGQNTTITFKVNNSTNSPFSNNNTKFTVGIYKLPYSEDEFKNNGKTFIQSVVFDRAIGTVGGAAVNGSGFGGDYQVLKTITATYVSTSQISVSMVVDMGVEAIAEFLNSDYPRYALYFQTGNHTLTTDITDKEKLLVSFGDFYVNHYVTDLIKADSKFLRHPENDPESEFISNPDAFPLDDIVAYSQFYAYKSKLDAEDEFIISEINPQIIAKKNDGTIFILEQFPTNVEGALIVSDNQYFDINSERPFQTSNGVERKTIKFKRRTDLDFDSGGHEKRYYEVYYPFIYRIEYWLALQGVNTDFFDTSEQNNGLNNEWFRFADNADWELYYRLNVKVKVNGNELDYTFDEILNSFDWDSNADWVSTIKAYDDDTDAELLDVPNSKKLVSTFIPTRIQAEFENQVSTPDLDFHFVAFKMMLYENGDVSGVKWYSSMWETENTWFKSEEGNGKILLDLDGDTVIATALIDENTIPNGNNQRFIIAARIFETAYDFKLTEDGEIKADENGIEKIIE